MSKSLDPKLILIIVAFLLCTLYQRVIDAAPKDKPSFRIIGDSSTTISAAPFIVNININGQFNCGGTLVSSTHVVTAAHCVKGKNQTGMVITGGATYLSDAGVKRLVSSAMVPSEYKNGTYHMDVAVLKLSSPMTGEKIRPIDLCNSILKEGDNVAIYGWGAISENVTGNSNTLRTVTVPVLSKSKCVENYRNTTLLTETMFCAAVPGEKDSCTGDSGGPAIYNDRLCGIISFGLGCARTAYPGVYTTVNAVRSFINKAIETLG